MGSIHWMSARTPTDAELVELHDRLWNDLRCRDDRSEFFECEHCGAAVRWIANLGSRLGSSMQIVARPVATAAFFDPEAHHGLVAVYTDRTGFTVSRQTPRDEVEGAFLYRCHWDTCELAKEVRDRLHRERRGVERVEQPEPMLDRYASWRRDREN